MWLKWFPWKFIVRRLAKSHGFLDPMALLSYLRGFAQPSEVTEPIELLRAGMVLHARGLMNSRVIQHNLDWVWPYWVEKQFDPADESFVPRAFSLTHINLTHRNWTAVGAPCCSSMPIVDPRGLVTPRFDCWSIDGWVLSNDGALLTPSKLKDADQRFEMEDGISVVTESTYGGMSLRSSAFVEHGSTHFNSLVEYQATSEEGGWLVVALRPYNPEGVNFIHEISLGESRDRWFIDKKDRIHFSEKADKHFVSKYHDGDVRLHLMEAEDENQVVCEVGMATAAAMFRLEPGLSRSIMVEMPLEEREKKGAVCKAVKAEWEEALDGTCRIDVPDQKVRSLFDTAVRNLILHSPGDVYPGPYTYKRFWFRDASLILHAMICAGLVDRAEKVLDRFPSRQSSNGYFHSQEGEWDSNGEALWIFNRFCELTGKFPKERWLSSIRNGARWIVDKRMRREEGSPVSGLLPAGFSAEHLGPNDFYYWDDFWAVAGLKSAADMLEKSGDMNNAEGLREEARLFMEDIERSLESCSARLGKPIMPASPYRRMDAGAIGSTVVGYPLQMCEAEDKRLTNTVEYLLENCFFENGFFQDMIHSGVNPYLTLGVAQILLRKGDSRYLDLMNTVRDLASPTGNWPEAVHPGTKGGCMGDGQHIWAAAEWVMMVRSCFVLEETHPEGLVLCAGIPEEWLKTSDAISFGPTLTKWGPVMVFVEKVDGKPKVRWKITGEKQPPRVEVRGLR